MNTSLICSLLVGSTFALAEITPPPAAPDAPSTSATPPPPSLSAPLKEDHLEHEIEHQVRAALREAKDAIQNAFEDIRSIQPEIQARVRESLALAQNSIEEVRKDANRANRENGRAPYPTPPGKGGDSFAFSSKSPNANAPLIVRSNPGAGDNSTLKEDLTVMHRILNRAVDRRPTRDGVDYQARVMGIELFTMSGPRQVQSMYLEGYGAVFLLNVGFPLRAAPATNETTSEKAENTEWERTRRELFDRESDAFMSGPGFLKMGPAEFEFGGKPRTARYDAQRVDDLKRDLLDSLKNAANLREVAANEFITIVVSGPRATHAEKSASLKKRDDTVESDDDNPAPKRRTITNAAQGQTTLTLRIKKSDAVTFAEGKSSLDDFKSKASIHIE